jgi:hypothetical protein
MFTWICPKCGKEVPPAYSECPNCAALENKPATVGPLTQEPPPAASPVPPAPVAEPVAAPPPLPPQAYARPTNRVAIPAWLVSLLVAAVLIIIGLTVVILRNSNRAAAAQSAAAAPVEAPAAPTAASQTNPSFRYVEFSGLRLTEDAKQKPFVQMVIVNHSGADLGELSAKVNLRAVSQKAQEPVGTFAFKASLGPYESKEIKAPLDTKLRVYELPDWQFLRAEVLP